jgi:hypothetical protein
MARLKEGYAEMLINEKGQEYIKKIFAVLIAGFVGFMVHWTFIHEPEVYATKSRVAEIKNDLCTDIKEIEARFYKQLDVIAADVRFIRQWYGPAKKP